MVVVRGGETSALDLIAAPIYPKPRSIITHRSRPLDPSEAIPAMAVRHIYVSGEPISILGPDFSFQFEASNVELY